MVNNHAHESPPSTYDGTHVHRPSPEKPQYDTLELGYDDPIFDKAVNAVGTQLRETRLPGWVYYDPFLRFLHSVGPRNAALIRSLSFSGVAQIHHYRQDLVNSLYMYMPFVKALCPNLRKLIISASEDDRLDAAHPLSNGPPSAEEALLPFLENELRTLTGLDELVVEYHPSEDTDDNSPTWAIDTQQWVITQSAERKKQEWLAQKQQIEDAKGSKPAPEIKCEFCAEEHVWPECYRLCPLCGEYGHFRPTCPRREEFRRPRS